MGATCARCAAISWAASAMLWGASTAACFNASMGKGRFEFRHIADAVRTSSALRCYVIALELELGLLRWKQAEPLLARDAFGENLSSGEKRAGCADSVGVP